MKIFRAKPHTIVTFNYRHQGKTQLAITIMAMFSFSKKNTFLSYPDFWKVAKKTFNFQQGESIDLHMPKKRAEFFVKGSCYAYDSQTSKSMVKVTLDNMHKQLTVFGDRQWLKKESVYQVSRPNSFTSIPLTLNNAFGGKEHDINPAGKGFTTEIDSIAGMNLPNIELAECLIRESTDTPQPAFLLPCSTTCQKQLDKFGTLNDDWLNNESPYYPADIDWLYFNRAEANQQREVFFKGDEEFTFTNMHPEKPNLKGQLPGLGVRCFYKHLEAKDTLNELNLNLDTIWLLPEEEKGILIWHGLIETKDLAASDIDYIYSVSEHLSEPKKEVAYYAELRNNPRARISNDVQEEKSKVRRPPLPRADFNLIDPFHPEKKPSEQGEVHKPFKGKAPDESLLEAKQYFESRNQPLPAFNDPFWFEDSLNSESNQQRKIQKSQHLDYLKKNITNSNLSESEKTAAIQKAEQQLDQIEQLNRGIRFRSGRIEKSTFSREDIIAGYQQQNDFSNENLTGIDLSELDLTGINLSGCNLRDCNLTRTCLDKADLSSATLINTNLTETILASASLANSLIKNSVLNRTNFKECALHYAKFEDCSGKECNFSKALLNYVVLKKCQICQSSFIDLKANFLDISECNFETCNFSEARMQFAAINKGEWTKINFAKSDLSHASFDSSNLSEVKGDNITAPGLSLNKCTITKLAMNDSNLEHLRCRGASLSDCSFSNSSLLRFNLMDATVRQANFIKCNLTNLRANSNTKISTSNFEQCNLNKLALFGGHYEKIAISNSELDASQFSNCTWTTSNFSKCDAKKFRIVNSKVDSCLFQDINFFQGIFYGSTFENIEFNHCNLYSISFKTCQKKSVKILDCLTKEISLNQEEPHES